MTATELREEIGIELARDALAPFRRFRHVVYHGYGFQLDWDRMAEGMSQVPALFEAFRRRLEAYLANLSAR
jgi:uncharacterized protein YutE (UPF0331/DUF86 family)